MISRYRPELAGNPCCADCGAVMIPEANPFPKRAWECQSCGGRNVDTRASNSALPPSMESKQEIPEDLKKLYDDMDLVRKGDAWVASQSAGLKMRTLIERIASLEAALKAEHNTREGKLLLPTEEVVKMRDELSKARSQIEDEQQAHNEIASALFAVGIETSDGTSVSAARNAAKKIAALEAQLADYGKHRKQKIADAAATLDALVPEGRTKSRRSAGE